MAQGEIYIKEGDRSPNVRATLLTLDINGNKVAINLTGSTVRFKMRPHEGGVLKIDAPAVVVDAVAGKCQYEWAVLDTDTPGRFHAEFEVTMADTRKETFPNRGCIEVFIAKDL